MDEGRGRAGRLGWVGLGWRGAVEGLGYRDEEGYFGIS